MSLFARSARFKKSKEIVRPGPRPYIKEAYTTFDSRAFHTMDNASVPSLSEPRLSGRIGRVDAEVIEDALEKLKLSVQNLQEDVKMKEKFLKDITRQIEGDNKSNGREVAQPMMVDEIFINPKKETKQLGPGEYMENFSFEFIKNNHSFNITNNSIYKEIQKEIEKNKNWADRQSKISSLYGTEVVRQSLSPASNPTKASLLLKPKKFVSKRIQERAQEVQEIQDSPKLEEKQEPQEKHQPEEDPYDVKPAPDKEPANEYRDPRLSDTPPKEESDNYGEMKIEEHYELGKREENEGKEEDEDEREQIADDIDLSDNQKEEEKGDTARAIRQNGGKKFIRRREQGEKEGQ